MASIVSTIEMSLSWVSQYNMKNVLFSCGMDEYDVNLMYTMIPYLD